MSKTLVIVESPAKSKKIQEILGKNYTVVASKGHIADLAKGGSFGIGVDVNNNFKPRYVLMDDKVETLDMILNHCETHKDIILATDADMEGEAIAWHLYQRIVDYRKPIKRAEFKEITKKGVQTGLKNLRDININLFHAQEARRILDRIVGFMASPFLTNTFGSSLSAGRVQSVCTRMIADREKEIDVFIPEEYWVIQTLLADKSSFWAKYEPKIASKEAADEVSKVLKNAEYVVSAVDDSEELRKPAPPMTTASLQRIMSKSFGFAADRTMKAAQSLYENGYITYLRTDSVRIEPDALKEVREWLSSNKYEIPKKPNTYKNKNEAQDAHECIRPTDITLQSNSPQLIGDEQKVYEIIWKYFVASQMMPAVYSTLKITVSVKDNPKHYLKASGKALKSQGFLEVMGISDNSQIDLPVLKVGQKLIYKDISCEKKKTQPPSRYSEDTLIKSLETKNIGRPATYAEILLKISGRNYVEKKGNTYYPTDLGRKVTECLNNSFTFVNYDYTSSIQDQLDIIEQGKLDHIDMLKSFYAQFKEELDKAYFNNGCPKCDKCGSPMVLRNSKKNEKFYGCMSYPNCRSIKNAA